MTQNTGENTAYIYVTSHNRSLGSKKTLGLGSSRFSQKTSVSSSSTVTVTALQIMQINSKTEALSAK